MSSMEFPSNQILAPSSHFFLKKHKYKLICWLILISLAFDNKIFFKKLNKLNLQLLGVNLEIIEPGMFPAGVQLQDSHFHPPARGLKKKPKPKIIISELH